MRALVQRDGDIPEMALAHDELRERGVEVTTFLSKHLRQRRVALERECLVVAELDVFELALRQLGVEAPTETCYPEALRPWLLRRVWSSTLGEVERAVLGGAELFVKPQGRIKRFTGRMVDESVIGALAGVSRRQAVWCSELVSFASEHRAFVVHGQVRDVRWYGGDDSRPAREVIDACVAAWTATGLAAHGYAIDFGVLRDGRTALLEVNDGYSLGAYGVSARDYVDVLLARWQQLMAA